jgi:hypothetical protein
LPFYYKEELGEISIKGNDGWEEARDKIKLVDGREE